MVLYPNKLPESERVCFGICRYANKLFHVLIVLLEQGKDGFVVLAVSQKLVFHFLGSNVIITPLHFVVDGVQRCVYIA